MLNLASLGAKLVGRKCVSRELRELIFHMVTENSTWGAPRIHGELKMLGFDVSERTVLRWMRKAPRNPEPAIRRAASPSNHRESIAAMDFFTVPTLTFGVLYCFFVIGHNRRRIFHCNVTRRPTSACRFVETAMQRRSSAARIVALRRCREKRWKAARLVYRP